MKEKFKYFRFITTKDGKREGEGKREHVFEQVNSVLWDGRITRSNKIRIFNTLVKRQKCGL